MEGRTEIFLIWINQFAESFFCKNGSFDQRNVLTFLFQNAVCPAKSDFVRCLFEMNATSEKNLMPFSAKIQWRWNITSCCLTVIAHSAEEVLPKLLVGAQEGRACGTTSANTNGLETLLRGPRFTARVTLGPFNWHHPRWKGRVWPYGAFKSQTHILELKKKKKKKHQFPPSLSSGIFAHWLKDSSRSSGRWLKSSECGYPATNFSWSHINLFSWMAPRARWLQLFIKAEWANAFKQASVLIWISGDWSQWRLLQDLFFFFFFCCCSITQNGPVTVVSGAPQPVCFCHLESQKNRIKIFFFGTKLLHPVSFPPTRVQRWRTTAACPV